VAGEGYPWHPYPARRKTGQKPTDRLVCVHKVRSLFPQHVNQRPEGAPMNEWRETPCKRDGDDAETFVARGGEQGTIGADTDDIMPTRAQGAHQRQYEMSKGKINIGNFDDFHVRWFGSRCRTEHQTSLRCG